MSKTAKILIIFDVILAVVVIGYMIIASGVGPSINIARKGDRMSSVNAEKILPEVHDEPEVTEAVTEFEMPSSYIIPDMNVVYQEPELPTGCEITALTILLNYLGFDVSKTTMADDYLLKDSQGIVGFDEAFIGTPYSYGGYGCFAPVIKDAANKYLAKNAEGYLAEDITGTDLDILYEYVARGIPVVTWSSMGLMSVYHRFAFTDANGKENYWFDNEHCVVLYGYDTNDGTVYISDPMYGLTSYGAERFREIYDELGKQAVIVEKIK